MEKGYVCNFRPQLTITRADGPDIQFRDGLYVTADEGAQQIIEANGWWLVHIHPRDVVEPEPAEAPKIRHGGRGSRTE